MTTNVTYLSDADSTRKIWLSCYWTRLDTAPPGVVNVAQGSSIVLLPVVAWNHQDHREVPTAA